MPDWLSDSKDAVGQESFGLLVGRIGLAFVLGCVVAAIYMATQRRRKNDTLPLATTLVLMTILIAMVTLVIGSNVARAFSLVGALSIVRFRTVVDDTRDTAFVIFAVVVGMAVGAGYPLVPYAGIPVVGLAALVLSLPGRRSSRGRYMLNVRMALGCDPDVALREIFARHFERHERVSAGTARQGAILDLTYRIVFRDDATAVPFVKELNQVEGVQGVELTTQS